MPTQSFLCTCYHCHNQWISLKIMDCPFCTSKNINFYPLHWLKNKKDLQFFYKQTGVLET